MGTIDSRMARRIGRRDLVWLGLLCGAFILLTVQVPFGLGGFDRPKPGLFWRLLEAPGIALGWGGVALLVVAIPYALVTWLRGRSPGKVIAVFGTLVFAVGVAGFAGALASFPKAGGGAIGGGLAAMLLGTLGRFLTVVVFLGVSIPGLLLSLAPLLLDTSHLAARRPGEPEDRPAQAWYPQPQVDDRGVEIPMRLPGTDVGPIRYRDPDPAPAPEPPPVDEAPADAAPAADDTDDDDPFAPPGSHLAAKAAAAGLPPPPPPPPPAPPPPPPAPSGSRVAVAGRAPPRIRGVRYVDGGDDAGPAVAPDAPPEALPGVRFERSAEREATLAPGVRFAQEPSPAAPADEPPPPSADEARPPSDVAQDDTFHEAPADEAASAGSPEASFEGAPSEEAPPPADVADPSEPSVEDDGAAPPLDAPDSAPARHRRKLAATTMFDRSVPEPGAGGKPPKPKPRSAKPHDIREALKGLFSSLSLDELPPARPDDFDEEPPTAAPPPLPDAPGQMKMFTGEAAKKAALPHPAEKDELFPAAVSAALERGSASLVLLKRRLNVGYARAASLMEALVAQGVLGDMTASGSRPTLITSAEWERRAR